MTHIQLYDTTLRDGSQGEGVSFSLQDKLLIARRLDEVGFDYIEGGYPLSNPKDTEFFEQIREQNLQHAKICAFGMTRRRGKKADDDPGMRALIESGAPVITLVGKTSAFHVAQVLRVALHENLEMISDSVRHIVDSGREVIYDAEHFFDGWKEDSEYARKTVLAAAEAGASLVALCDTNGGSMPEEVARITKQTIALLPIPVGIHCHNDCGLAVANSLASVDSGAVQIQGTINGLGERCGNVDLIAVAANLAVKKQGYQILREGSIERLTELSRYVYETANMHFINNQPFVGPSAFAHKGGMHVHAIARDSSSYEHISPEAVGNERRILVSELSGRSNILAKSTKHDIENNPSLMNDVLRRVVEMENQGYQFEAAEASFELLVQKCAGTYRPKFERLHYHVSVTTKDGSDNEGAVTTEATVKLRVDGAEVHEVAEGDGPVNALDAALRKALNGAHPTLRGMHLVDYKVRVINSEAATAASVRVVIESRDEHDVWGTVGVHENVIEASWMALVDSFQYKLYKDEIAARESSPAAK